MKTPRRRIVIAAVAALSVLAAPVLAGTAQADPPPTIAPSPSQFGDPTVAPIDIAGVGLSADDTIVDTSEPTHVIFSSITSDGAGGLDALVTVTAGAVGSDTIEVRSPSNDVLGSCAGCLTTGVLDNDAPDAVYAPHDGSLGLRLFKTGSPVSSLFVTWTPPGGPTQSQTIPATGDAATSTTISGLTNATPYVFTVAEEIDSIVSDDRVFTEEVGVPPDAPTLTDHRLCCNVDAVIASGQTWTTDSLSSPTYTFTLVPRKGGGSPTVITGTSPFIDPQDFNAAGVTVTASVTNPVGTSPLSKPIVVRPIVVSTPVRDEHYRFTHGQLTVSWQPPANSGNSAVKDYRVSIRHGHQHVDATTTGLSFRIPLKPGSSFDTDIRPITQYGVGEQDDNTFGTAYLDVITALNPNGRAKWRYDDQGGWHHLGGRFARPPQPFMRKGHILTFVGADSHGHALIRTLTSGWRSLSPTTCRRPTATWGALGVDIACRAADGTLRLSTHTPQRKGLPYVPASWWVSTGLRIVGGPQSGAGHGYSGLIVVRTAPWDKAGDDLRTYDTINGGAPPLHFGKIHLACTGPVSITAVRSGMIACRTSPRTITWRGFQFGGHGVLTTPYRMMGSIALTASDNGGASRVAVSDRSGRIHVLDISEDQRWTLGTATTAGIGGTCVKGCTPTTR